jgi:hypothetical protein
MVSYCSAADVGQRLGLDSAQRSRAESRINSCIRRAGVKIDQCFLDYGRDEPHKGLINIVTHDPISANSTTIVLPTAVPFSTSGSGNIDGDSFSWTGKTSINLTGCTGISFDHAVGVIVQEGQMAHALRELCADIASGLYLEDESTHQTTDDIRGKNLRMRGYAELQRLAHLGKA